MRRTSIKHGVWHLDVRKRQKGGFLPIVGTLAKPLLVSTAGAVGGEVLIGIGRNNIWGENAVEKKEEKDIDMLRNKILLPRLPNLWRVQLPNGCVFFAK